MSGTLDNGYEAFMNEGDKYLKTAKGGIKRPAIFTAEILYNIIGLAIEKHVMAALMAKGKLADNHTFTDLIDAADQVGGIGEEIAAQLLKFESYQNICPVFAGYHRAEPPVDAIPEMIDTAEAVQAWAKTQIAA
ncbi:hypothetical protein [Pontiella agarivorans]|uniref:HEPN domain-containing protein n=1 Tax=Pontiella agarivorans TaxID=3038953 RepID=A0ABU5MYX5_9BACT|nr:hypothetical protein [Pontiella agarivorans]MDZ8119372.1 hypothetical protein [Pontiella agarivorans]